MTGPQETDCPTCGSPNLTLVTDADPPVVRCNVCGEEVPEGDLPPPAVRAGDFHTPAAPPADPGTAPE